MWRACVRKTQEGSPPCGSHNLIALAMLRLPLVCNLPALTRPDLFLAFSTPAISTLVLTSSRQEVSPDKAFSGYTWKPKGEGPCVSIQNARMSLDSSSNLNGLGPGHQQSCSPHVYMVT